MFPEKCSSGIKLHVIFALSSSMNYREGGEISPFNFFETKYCSFIIPKYDIQKPVDKSEIFIWLNTLEKNYFVLEGTCDLMVMLCDWNGT